MTHSVYRSSWNLCKFVVCDICLFVLPASCHLSSGLSQLFFFFFFRTLLPHSTSPSRSCSAAAGRTDPSLACRSQCWGLDSCSTRSPWERQKERCSVLQRGAAVWCQCGDEGVAAGWCAGELPEGKQWRPQETEKRNRMRSSQRRRRSCPGLVARGCAAELQELAEQVGWRSFQTWKRKQTR